MWIYMNGVECVDECSLFCYYVRLTIAQKGSLIEIIMNIVAESDALSRQNYQLLSGDFNLRPHKLVGRAPLYHFATHPFLKTVEDCIHYICTEHYGLLELRSNYFLNNRKEIFYMEYLTLKMSTISWMFISRALCVHSYILQYPNYSWTVGVIGFKFCMMLPNMPVSVNIYCT